MEKKIVLLSNSKDYHVKNSLSHFQNHLYDPDYLPSNKTWYFSTEYVGFHACFKNQLTSKNNTYPAVIHTTIYDLFGKKKGMELSNDNMNNILREFSNIKLSDFTEEEKIHFNEKNSYTPKSVHKLFTEKVRNNRVNKMTSYRGYITKFKESTNEVKFSQYQFPFHSL